MATTRILATAVLAVCVAANPYTHPTLDRVYAMSKHWEDFASRRSSSRALVDQFTRDAKICMHGTCGGIELLDQFENIMDNMHCHIPREQVVIGDNFVTTRWNDIARVGHCDKHVSGTHLMYYAPDGRIKEYHSVWDTDAMAALEWLNKNCMSDADYKKNREQAGGH